MDGIQTCSRSLLTPGVCCVPECSSPAAVAALTDNLVEHAMCESCAGDDSIVETKPLVWAEHWGPPCQ